MTGNNHSPGCGCGWCCGGWRGGGGWSGGSSYRSNRQSVPYFRHGDGSYWWTYHDGDFCFPTTCPHCGATVFFVRFNGGSVWFNSLGQPWPKHGCFYSTANPYLTTRNSTYDRLLQYSRELRPSILGVIIATRAIGQGHALVKIRAENRKNYVVKAKGQANPEVMIGEVILLSTTELRLVLLERRTWVDLLEIKEYSNFPYVINGRYRHETFGIGTLSSYLPYAGAPTSKPVYVLTIDFDEHGVKKLMSNYAKLKWGSDP